MNCLPIHAAFWTGDLATLKQAIACNPSQVDERDQFGRSALHWASVCRMLDLAEALTKGGADPFSPDIQGNSPIALLFEDDYDPIEDIDPLLWGPREEAWVH